MAGRKEIAVDQDYVFTFRFYMNGLQVIPSEASAVVYNNAGTTVVSDNCSVTDTTGDVSFTLTAAYNTIKARNFKIVVTYVEDGTTKYYTELFDVVTVPLVNLCSDEVLFDKMSELRTLLTDRPYVTTGAGTLGSLECSAMAEDTRDYSGGYLHIFLSNSAEHFARITQYTKGSGSIMFEPDYTSEIASGTTFSVRPSFQRKIDDAFDLTVKRDIRNKLGLASRYIDSNLVTNLTAYKTLEMYSLSQMEQEGDKWDLRMKAFKELYSSEMSALQEASDSNDDGNISDAEDENRPDFNRVEIIR